VSANAGLHFLSHDLLVKTSRFLSKVEGGGFRVKGENNMSRVTFLITKEKLTNL